MSNKKDMRIQLIAKDILQHPNQTLKELAEKYNVSVMTVRRDLATIHDTNLVNNYYYSSIAKTSKVDYHFGEEQIKHLEKKERIAKFAISLLSPNETIILDNGTTSELIAALIPDNLPLTVICYSNSVISQLCNKKNITLISAGGVYHPESQTFESLEGVELLKRLRAQKMFMSCSGIHPSLGLTCYYQYEVAMKQAAISSSYQKILVADSSKTDVIKSSFFARLDTVDMHITDSEISDEWKKILTNNGIKLHVV